MTLSKVERFEDLFAWQKARGLARAVYDVSRQGAFSRDFELCRQIHRAAISTMSNIAEGFERGQRGEFHQFLSIAKSSCAELRSQLYVAFDVGYIDDAQFTELLAQAEEVGRIIGGLRAGVDKQRDGRRSTP